MNITKDRWNEAQSFEKKEWLVDPKIIELELDEVTKKYTEVFGEYKKTLQLTDNSKIIDVGCGPTCASRLFEKGIKYGIDPLAHELGYEGVHEGVTISAQAAEQTDFIDKNFDLAICINAIDHTHDPDAVLSETSRILIDDGYLILSSYVYNSFIVFVRNFCEVTGIKKNVGHPHVFTEHSIKKVIGKYFDILDTKILYTGMSPTDYGKSFEVIERNPLLARIILFINYKILGQRYYVKNFVCLAKKK